MPGMENKFEELRPLQKKHSEMLSYINSFCSENGISFCLAYGSALGAERHGGPIPWDDDADICMPAADYEKFRRLFNEKGDKERFYLQEMGPIEGMACTIKLRMNNTAYIEETYREKDMHQGIFVDIFLLHDKPASALGRMGAVAGACYFIIKELSNNNYKKRRIVRPLILFLRLFGRKFGMKTAYRLMYRADGSDSGSYADWGLYTARPRWYIRKDIMFPARLCEYDGMKLPVPGKTDEYLRLCYGDWHRIPDISSIEWAQHSSEWSTERDFRSFAPNIKDFRDERF